MPTHRDAEPISDPGLPAHTWRPTDVDPKAEKRAERQIAAMFIAAMISAVLFVVAYFSFEVGDNWDTFAGLGASTITLGLTLGVSLLLIGTGIIHLARKLMADHEMVEMRHPAASPQEDRDATVQALNDGLAEAGIGRRPLVRNTMLGAIGVLGLPDDRAAARPGSRQRPRHRASSGRPSGSRACAWCATSSARPSSPARSRSAT